MVISSSPFRRACKQPADDGRHFGLVVDDKEAARRALHEAGVAQLDGPFLDFRDPWGNRIEIVDYENIQFTKAPNVLRGMGAHYLTKNDAPSNNHQVHKARLMFICFGNDMMNTIEEE